MKLISVISNYQLLEAILYKLTYLKNDKVVLLLSNTLAVKYPNYKSLSYLFENLIIFSFIVKYDTELQDQQSYFDSLLQEYGYNICDFSEVFCAAAHHSFGLYLVQKKVNFVFLEDGAGILSSYTDLMKVEFEINPVRATALEKFGLYSGTSKYIQYIIADKNKLSSGFEHSKNIVHFSLKEALATISESDINLIISFFGFHEKIIVQNNSCVVFTEQFANLRIFNYEYQCKTFQFLVDYFFKNFNLIIKPHPDDITYYSLLFPHATIIKTKFPAEIFPYITTKDPEYLAGISTSSIHNLDYTQSKIFSLDFKARNTKIIDSFHKYYVLAKLLGLNNKHIKIYEKNIYRILLDKMIEFHSSSLSYSYTDNIDDCDYAIIDQETDDQIISSKNQNKILFLSNPFEYIDPALIYKNIYPIKLTKEQTRSDFAYEQCNIEYIYLYDTNINKEAMCFMHKFDLKNSGIEIKAETLTEEKLQIAILEGVLEATEKRLTDEINKNNELELKLKKYEG